MTKISLSLLPILMLALIVGCSRTDRRTADETKRSAATTDAENTARNERDRSKETMTPTDQSESEADREITRNIRQAIVKDDSLSTTAKNVKIVTSNGVVTLRGPVKNEREKTEIAAKVKQVTGVRNVDNQLEVENK